MDEVSLTRTFFIHSCSLSTLNLHQVIISRAGCQISYITTASRKAPHCRHKEEITLNPEHYKVLCSAYEVAEFDQESMTTDAMHQDNLSRISGCQPCSDRLLSLRRKPTNEYGRRGDLFKPLMV